MKPLAACLALLILAACGADGDPLRPTASGSVSVGSGGVSTDATIGATNGTVTFGLSL